MSAFDELLNYVEQLQLDLREVEASVCRRFADAQDWENVILRTRSPEKLGADIPRAVGDWPGTEVRVRVFLAANEDVNRRKAARTFHYVIDEQREFTVNLQPVTMNKAFSIDEFQKAVAEIIPPSAGFNADLLNAKVECAELRAEVKRLDIRCEELKEQRDAARARLETALAEIERLRETVRELEKEPTGLNGLLAEVDGGEAIKSLASLGEGIIGLFREKQATRRQELEIEAARLRSQTQASPPYEPPRQRYAPPEGAFIPDGYVDENASFIPDSKDHGENYPQS